MSYYKDEHLIISCEDEKTIADFRKDILESIRCAFADEDYEPNYAEYVSSVLSAMANGGYYLYLPPDGSKEGWTTSEVMDDVRERIRSKAVYLNAQNENSWSKRLRILKIVEEEAYDKPTVEDFL